MKQLIILILFTFILNKINIKDEYKKELYNDNDNLKNKMDNEFIIPLNSYNIISIFLLCLIIFLGLMAGIGGGIFIVPLATYLLGMEIKQATGFTNFIMWVNTFIRYIYNLFKNDPNKNHKTMIDYDIIWVFNPILLIGTLFGVIINNIIPQEIILILLLITIICSFIKTIKKTIKLFKQENNGEEVELNKVKLINFDENEKNINILTNNNIEIINKIKQSESRNFHPFKFTIIWVTIIISIFITIFKSNKSKPSIIGIERCTVSDFLLYILYVLISLIILYISIIHVYKFNKLKIENNFLYKHEIKYDKKNLIKIPIMSFIIGFVAALTGIGGSIITTPFLYHLNYSPVITSNVSLFLAFINKIASVIGTGINGYILWDYALFYSIFVIITSWISEILWIVILKKFKRQSIISMVFIFLIASSFILIIYKLITVLKDDSNRFMFNSYCN